MILFMIITDKGIFLLWLVFLFSLPLISQIPSKALAWKINSDEVYSATNWEFYISSISIKTRFLTKYVCGKFNQIPIFTI